MLLVVAMRVEVEMTVPARAAAEVVAARRHGIEGDGTDLEERGVWVQGLLQSDFWRTTPDCPCKPGELEENHETKRVDAGCGLEIVWKIPV